MKDLDYIKMEALSLPEGETTTVTCCFCGKDKKLSITRKEDGIVYNCWSASCSGKGFIGSYGATHADRVKPIFKPSKYPLATELLTEEMYDHLADTYGLNGRTLRINGIRQAKWINELLIPLFDRIGARYGQTTKNLDRRHKKSIHYIERPEPMLHYTNFNLPSTCQGVVLVEDCLSAMRVTQLDKGWRGVALLGTILNRDKVRNLKKGGNNDIIIALDPDATNAAWKLQRKYGLFFDTCKVAVMSADPKDSSDNVLEKELGI